jgi:hypothetical protein
LHLIRKVPTRGRWRERLAVLTIEVDRFFHDSAEFVEDLLFVGAVIAAVQQAGRTPDLASVFFGPFDDLHVTSTVFHERDSSIARLIALASAAW